MTTFTMSELATRVLKDLGLLGVDEVPSADDLAYAEQTVSSELELLQTKDIEIWNGNEESTPNAYLTALSRRIGLALAPSYGLTDIATATQAMPIAERDLRNIGSVPATGSVAEATYY